MTSRPRTPLIRRVRRIAARVAAGLFAIVVLVGFLRGGARYVYCPMMQAIIDAPCCSGDRHDGDGDGDHEGEAAAVRSRDCCEEHVVAKLPKAAGAGARTVLDAPLVAVLPPQHPRFQPSAMDRLSHFEHENRAGPPSAARHRAELMVFLN